MAPYSVHKNKTEEGDPMKSHIKGVALLAGMLLIAGCGTGGSAPDPSGQTGESAETISDQITSDPVTLTVSYVQDPPVGPLVDGFTALHPNVTVDLIQTPFADYQTSLKLAMSSADGPDVVQYSPGPMRSIVPAGLVQPLEEYAELYGWKDIVSPSLLGMLTSNETATEYGVGSLYAIPGAVQLVGVFYNKELVEDAGITALPATLSEFEDHLDMVKNSGSTPLSMPALGVSGFQLWGALSNVLADPSLFNDWVSGKPGTSLLDDPGFTEAAAKIKEWGDAGYFAEGVAAVDDNDGIAELTTGERAYYLTGNWNANIFANEMEDNVGFFLLPGLESEQPSVAMGSGFPYSISAQSDHKDVAAAFLNYMVSEDVAQSIYDSGFVPTLDTAEVSGDGLKAEVFNGYQDVVKGAGIAPFANWATSSMIDTLTSGVQGVISGNLSPEDFVQSLQDDWENNQQ